MRVYYPGGLNSHTMYVSPAADPRATKAGTDAAWVNESGEPRMIEVHFKNGRADVPDPLGKYLVATGMAKRTALLIPRGVAA
jgi:hypothetical protein